MNNVIFIGAGDYAETVYDSLDKNKYKLVYFIDEFKTGTHLDIPIISKKIEDIQNYKDYLYFITIGDTSARNRWYLKLQELSLNTFNVIDDSSIVSPFCEIGTGNFIGKTAVVNIKSKIGDNNMIHSKSLIEHHCCIGNSTRISTAAVLNGGVTVDDGAYIGSSACCIGHQIIGKYSTVGAGAVVLDNVEQYSTVVGVPARIIKREV